jgi:hypothetical protein
MYSMRSVYDVEIEGGNGGREMDEKWPERTLARWQDIRAEFGVTDVLVYSRVALQLPLVARGEPISLYTIPPAAPR